MPSCDRRIVFSAIDGQLNAAKIAWREKNNANDEQPHTAAKVEFFVDCIERTCESLKRQIDIATVPVDEMRVEGAVDSLRTRLLSLATRPSNDGDRGGSSPSSSPSSVDDDASDEIYEFEDDDIVDRDAYDQVKRLRAQAREVSSRVIAIREETTARTCQRWWVGTIKHGSGGKVGCNKSHQFRRAKTTAVVRRTRAAIFLDRHPLVRSDRRKKANMLLGRGSIHN